MNVYCTCLLFTAMWSVCTMTRGQVQIPDILRISYFLNLTNELYSTVITQSMKPPSLMCGWWW